MYKAYLGLYHGKPIREIEVQEFVSAPLNLLHKTHKKAREGISIYSSPSLLFTLVPELLPDMLKEVNCNTLSMMHFNLACAMESW